MTFLEEVQRRRTFAIISHPDAGKTTLTENYFYTVVPFTWRGQLNLVKQQNTPYLTGWKSKTTWYLRNEFRIAIRLRWLSCQHPRYPGHQDFSEDTYRTLMAADSAVMLIDVAKGVEAQTKKLFAVSKERGIPIFTFVNKIDHFGRSPFDLMEEIENVLGIRTCPMNWPIGINGEYKGVYDREHETIELFAKRRNTWSRKASL